MDRKMDESYNPPWWFFVWIGWVLGSFVTFAICVNAPHLKEAIARYLNWY